VFHKLCSIAWSSTYFLCFNMKWHRIAYFVPMVPLRTYSLIHSRVCKTLSVSMLDYAWSVSVSSDLKQQKFFLDKLFIAMHPVKVDMIHGGYTILQNTK